MITLDGKKSFHGMDIISVSTPSGGDTLKQNTKVTRLKQVASGDITINRDVPIQRYTPPLKAALSSRIRIEDAQIDILEEENAVVEDILYGDLKTCEETPKSPYVLSESDTIELHNIASNLLELTTIVNVIESNSFRSLSDDILNHRCLLERKSQTAKLWLLYMKYIEVLKLFIRAERIGDWNTHLIASLKMLNLFASTGHINYAKSTRLYLQMMHKFSQCHPLCLRPI